MGEKGGNSQEPKDSRFGHGKVTTEAVLHHGESVPACSRAGARRAPGEVGEG